MGKVYVGDVGTRIMLDCGADISDAEVSRIYYLKPDLISKGYWDATLAPGNVRQLYYDTEADDVDSAGRWTLQAYVEIGTSKWWGENCRLMVYSPETQ